MKKSLNRKILFFLFAAAWLILSCDEGSLSTPGVIGITPTNDTTPAWSWGAVEEATKYRYGYAEGTWITESAVGTNYIPSSPLSYGDNTLYVQAGNDAGDWSLSGSFTITIKQPLSYVWRKREPAQSPESRVGHSLTYAGGDKLILFGGSSDNSCLSDTWEYDLSANTWTEYNTAGTIPDDRSYHSMAYSYEDGRLYLFGGTGYGMVDPFSDTWQYNISDHSWTEPSLTGDGVPFRMGHAMAYGGKGENYPDSEGKKIILFGGHRETMYDLAFYGSTWEFDNFRLTWDKFNTEGTTPGARSWHAMAYAGENESGNSTFILFGGMSWTLPHYPNPGTQTFLGDTWKYDRSIHMWTPHNTSGERPEERSRHAMAYLGDNKVLLFGGSDGSTTFGDTWIYDAATLTWEKYEIAGDKPPAQTNHAMANIGENKIILFGKNSEGGTNGETWVFELE
ncbi:MAG: hypothetical protein GY754_05715 [bacterium]|nr:hypothetical protein [bacterium]